ncbi:uncharacterized protein MONOS_13042 [Monocercomonoides exilis]|uniref:uncharacterized protein n=1 Tax=Monocercomonoides exilis TaxID=2049356 RepID=UPI0035593E82|nr:hypothetical protein MONOS_13042 [Monocercomonoides exilis]|eukprot:MONOS_13042.1-p1 / transcript=MONOS_13042.1 / gene=MONOS_13042 / organism=Monocercomonoides_exilis_PA203 / gene_product=unspecified product / transcript_product=unspecified product / location=Mono_scaffold00770:15738-16993(-) / protein_length=305 / sequence_SO=supercontig / SO=protein_coding / is_pseudo=false
MIVIDFSDASAVAALFTSAAEMDNVEWRLRIIVSEAAGVYARDMLLLLLLLLSTRVLQTLRDMLWCVERCCMGLHLGKKSGIKRIFAAANVNSFPSIYDLFDLSLQIWRSPQSRHVVVKLDDEVMGRGVEVCDMGEIVENGLSVVGLRMKDVVLSSAAIALAVLEKREEAEEAKEKEKKMEKKLAADKMNKKEKHEKVKQEIKKKSQEVQEAKEAKGQLVATKEKVGLIGVRIEKEKKGCSLQSEVVNLNGKGVVAKVGSEASVARKINSGDGGGGGKADATVQQKMNKMEKETKMLTELWKVQ